MLKKEKQKVTNERRNFKMKNENLNRGSRTSHFPHHTSSNGITLIALIITIIIMLILVAVSVSVAINGGLFGYAKEATEKTRLSQIEERVSMWKIVQKADEVTEGSETQSLENLLDELESQKLITSEERTEIEEKGSLTIGDKTIVFRGTVKVGDYVDYTPAQPTAEAKAQLESDINTYSGYTTEQQTVEQENLQWRVLNINDDGTIDLITVTPTASNQLYFQGALGYNNGVYLLNEYCNVLYGNPAKGAIARSLNIEDIQDKMDLSIWDYNTVIGTKKNNQFYRDYGQGGVQSGRNRSLSVVARASELVVLYIM